ncbi:MAG: 1-acyl-sn-glycerol-3-phosphate acyltransferase [Chloroflexota bacterium]|jgi:1-acyl-sn-glycerol-3-phosphate acyltransferase
MKADIRALTAMNVTDLQKSFRVHHRPIIRRIVATLGWYPAYRLARSMAECDALAGQHGLSAAGHAIVTNYAGRVEVAPSTIPKSGPVLICANHPGMVDASALFTAIPRNDVLVIAADRPLLRAMPNIAARLICVPDDPAGRARIMREAARHLKNGGALLTFPAGKIEPDPAVMDDAHTTLADWSDVTALFCRLVPDLPVVGALISGVISARALNNWWIRRIPERKERDWMAATLQLIVPWYKVPRVRIRWTDPIVITHEQVKPTLAAHMHQLIQQEYEARR